jgi:predicted nucleotidyltransferase
MRLKHEPPPMDLPTLMAGLTLSDELRRNVGDLLVKKAGGEEQDLSPRIMAVDEFIGATLSEPVGQPSLIDHKHNTANADALFASIALNRQTIAYKT